MLIKQENILRYDSSSYCLACCIVAQDMLVSLIIIFTHLVIQTSGQSCRSTALTGTGEELYSTYGNNSLSTFGDLDGNYTCPSQIITDATKFAQCSASVIIRGQFSLLGLIEAKCYRSPNASVIINGRIELGCCSSLVTNGIVVAANASLISLGVNSTFSLSYLSMEEGSKFLMGDLVDVKNGINEGHISIGSGSSMFINTELSTIRHTMEIDSAQVSLIDRSEMVLTG